MGFKHWDLDMQPMLCALQRWIQWRHSKGIKHRSLYDSLPGMIQQTQSNKYS